MEATKQSKHGIMLSNRVLASWRFGGGNFVAIIAAIMASVSLLKIVIDFSRLPISVFLDNVLKSYVVVFHTMFDVLFFWLPLTVPSSVKDTAVLYLLLGSATCAGELASVRSDLKHPWLIQHNFKNSKSWFWLLSSWRLVRATIAWPLWLWQHRDAPHLMLPLGSHGPGRAHFVRSADQGERYAYICDVRLVMLFRLASIILSAVIILAFNYAFSI